MRTDSDGTYRSQRLQPSIRPTWIVGSYLDDEALGDIPVLGGTITDDESNASRGQLSLTVPLLPELLPTGATAPLGNNGQRLHVRKSLNGSEIDLGQFVVIYARPDNGVIDVVADGPLILLDLARLTADVNYDGTFVGAIKLLTQNVITVVIDDALTDRPLPQAVVWSRGDSRLDRFHEILTAWPADVSINSDGQVLIRPPYDDDTPGDPVETYTDGKASAAQQIPATLIDLAPTGDTQDAYNAEIVATAPGEGLSGVQSGAYVTAGPTAWSGPYGRRPGFFSSPLLAEADLPTVAVNRLQKDQRRQGTLRLQVITDDRIEIGDIVRAVQGSTDTDVTGRVTATRNGVTAADDPTEITISTLSGTVNGEPVVRGGITIGTAPDPSGVASGTVVLSPAAHGTYFGGGIRTGGVMQFFGNNIFQGQYTDVSGNPWNGEQFWLFGGATYDEVDIPGVVTSMRVRLLRVDDPRRDMDNPPPLHISLMEIVTDEAGAVAGWGPVVASLTGPQLVSNDPTEFALPTSWLPKLFADLASGDKRALGLHTETETNIFGVTWPNFQILADWEGNV